VENYAIPSLGFLIVVVVGFLFTFLRGRRSERVMALVVGLGLLLLPLGVFVLSWVAEAIFHAKVAARYLILIIPLYSLSLGLGIRVLWQKRPILAILAVLFILGCLSYTLAGYYAERYRTYHLPAMASYIAAHSEPDQAVVFYTDRRWPIQVYHVKTELRWYAIPYGAKMTPQEADHWLAPVLEKHDAIWLVTIPEAGVSDPKGEIPIWLKSRLHRVWSQDYGDTNLTLFARDGSSVPRKARLTSTVIHNQRKVDLGGLVFLGFDRLPKHVRTGDTLYVTTYWQASGSPDARYSAEVALVDADGVRFWGRNRQAVDVEKDELRPGDTIQFQHKLNIGPNRAAGRYGLELVTESLASGERLSLPLGEVNIEGVPKLSKDWRPASLSGAALGGVVQLVGYEMSSHSLKPGEMLRISLFWRALAEMDTSYTVFVQLLDESNRVWLQRDTAPARGTCPTHSWSPGDMVRDDYSFSIPEEAASGERKIIVGMYNPATLKRLPLLDKNGKPTGEDKVFLEPVQIGG
ncbi:MAG: hypothetical protein ABIH46_08880, partial [Chloroflexota bacterium]